MSHPMVIFEDAFQAIGVLPSVGLHPKATNLCVLLLDLIDKLMIIPSEQSADLGCKGLIQQDEVYAIHTGVPWVDYPNIGPVPPTNPAWKQEESRNSRVNYDASKNCVDSEANICQATNNALNLTVPRQLRLVLGGNIGVCLFRPTDSPTAIINHLRRKYEHMSPAEKTAMKQGWMTG